MKFIAEVEYSKLDKIELLITGLLCLGLIVREARAPGHPVLILCLARSLGTLLAIAFLPAIVYLLGGKRPIAWCPVFWIMLWLVHYGESLNQ